MASSSARHSPASSTSTLSRSSAVTEMVALFASTNAFLICRPSSRAPKGWPEPEPVPEPEPGPGREHLVLDGGALPLVRVPDRGEQVVLAGAGHSVIKIKHGDGVLRSGCFAPKVGRPDVPLLVAPRHLRAREARDVLSVVLAVDQPRQHGREAPLDLQLADPAVRRQAAAVHGAPPWPRLCRLAPRRVSRHCTGHRR